LEGVGENGRGTLTHPESWYASGMQPEQFFRSLEASRDWLIIQMDASRDWLIYQMKAGWNWLAETHRERFIGNLTEEDHQLNFRTHFDRAKLLSDFIGVIVRLSFATFAWKYFLERASETDGIRNWAFNICFYFAVGVTIALSAHISAIIMFYETKAVPKQTNKVWKLTSVTIALMTTFALWYGINDLVASLIKSGVTPK
jgi:hypothetical protein